MTERDVHAIDGKIATPDTRFEVVVVGAGSAGTQAAIDAAQSGASVLLIDENPVAGALMGTDVPLFYGGRMTAAVQNPGRMIEQIFAANPRLEAAFEAGVDVRLGTVAWGLYVASPALRALPEPLLGIADGDEATMVGFGRLVLATGARDIMLAFPGWDRPGVMGAQGFAALLTRYDALASRRIVILGSDTLGLETALLAIEHGIAVAAIVEVADSVQGPAALAERVRAAGVPILLGQTVAGTHAGIEGIEGLTIAAVSPANVPDTPSPGNYLACDTVVVALGVAPATELLEAAGAKRGDEIVLVGDCATVTPPDDARLAAWAAALALHASADMIVCQCEEVTRGDLLGVQPPRYLDRPAPMAARSLTTLLNDGPAHPDQIKRLTRAGMGPCQGRRCRESVRCLLATEQGGGTIEGAHGQLSRAGTSGAA